MKTTSYEISKQLKKNGLSEKLGFMEYYYNTDKQLKRRYEEPYCSTWKENTQVDCFSYDLETILEALPNFIANKNKGENCLVIDVAFGVIHYEGDSDNETMFITTTEENESLADTAAKMWLKLKKEGLV